MKAVTCEVSRPMMPARSESGVCSVLGLARGREPGRQSMTRTSTAGSWETLIRIIMSTAPSREIKKNRGLARPSDRSAGEPDRPNHHSWPERSLQPATAGNFPRRDRSPAQVEPSPGDGSCSHYDGFDRVLICRLPASVTHSSRISLNESLVTAAACRIVPRRPLGLVWLLVLSLMGSAALAARSDASNRGGRARPAPATAAHQGRDSLQARARSAFWYPKWIPGTHAPSGPLDTVGGLRLETAGRQGDRLAAG